MWPVCAPQGVGCIKLLAIRLHQTAQLDKWLVSLNTGSRHVWQRKEKHIVGKAKKVSSEKEAYSIVQSCRGAQRARHSEAQAWEHGRHNEARAWGA